MFDLLDAPARILSYQDAGYDRNEARRMTRLDMQSAASDVLSKDHADPVSIEIEELGEPPMESQEEINAMEKYQTAYELKAVVGVCNDVRIGMDDVKYRLGAAIMNNLNGRCTGSQVMLKLEDVHEAGISPNDLMLHFEDSVGQTLKNIWQSIRNAFVNTFNKLKTWYIKAFDATQRLGNKAAAVKQQAENKQGTVNNNSFEMNGLTKLSIGNRAPDQAQFVQAINNMAAITQEVLGTNAKHYNNINKNMEEYLKNLISDVESKMPAEAATTGGQSPQAAGTAAPAATPAKPSNNVTTGQDGNFTHSGDSQFIKGILDEATHINQAFSKFMKPWTDFAQDKRYAQFAENQAIPVQVLRTENPLPGDMMFVTTAMNQAPAGVESLTALKMAFGGNVAPIKEQQGERQDTSTFKTLNPSQVVNICDSVMNACKAGLDYKLLFNERDNGFKQLGKQLDSTVSQADKLQGKALTFVKGNVSAATTIFKKINSVEGNWFRYSMGVFTKAVDYCQGSLNQIT